MFLKSCSVVVILLSLIKTPSRILGTESSLFKTSNVEIFRRLHHLLHGGLHASCIGSLTSGDAELFKTQPSLWMHCIQISLPCPFIITELGETVKP